MKKQLLVAGVFCSALLTPHQAIAATFTSLNVIGDSLSDTGNVFTFSGGLPPAPYFNGRFSNGPNWIDFLGQKLGLTPTPIAQALFGAPATQGINFATGGATTGGANTISSLLPGLLPNPNAVPLTPAFAGQLGLATLAPLDPTGLYVVWAGANDYLPTTSPDFQPNPDPAIAVGTTLANIQQAIGGFYQLGARNFLVVDLPRLGQTPLGLSQGPLGSLALDQITAAHNQGLQQGIGALSSFLPGVQITTFNVSTLFDQALAGQLGFTNVNTPCLNLATFTACQNAEQYLFWDGTHPTSKAHSLIANQAFQTLQGTPTSVPEPTAIVGLLAVGLLGVGSKLRQGSRHITKDV